MFTAMLKEHQRSQEELKAEINSKRVIAEKAVEELTAKNVRYLNDDISRVYMNEHKLDTEARKLQDNVSKLTKQAQQWMIVCKNLNGAIKDLGHINSWTRKIEEDVKAIGKVIQDSYKTIQD